MTIISLVIQLLNPNVT